MIGGVSKKVEQAVGAALGHDRGRFEVWRDGKDVVVELRHGLCVGIGELRSLASHAGVAHGNVTVEGVKGDDEVYGGQLRIRVREWATQDSVATRSR